MEKKIIVISADGLSVGSIPGDVALMFHDAGKHFGLAEEIQLTLRLAPDEARRLALALQRKADEAEARSPQPIQTIQAPTGTKQ